MALKDAVYRTLAATDSISDRRLIGPLWWRLAAQANEKWGRGEVATTLHGRRVLINFANPYPRLVRRYPNYNAPQVEIVSLAAEATGAPVTVVDVGAAVGDTALLLLERCSPVIDSLQCVEGEPVFAATLRKNLADPKVRIHEVVLADRPGPVPDLIRSQHEGTALAHGSSVVEATTLDNLFGDLAPQVIKIDTDGFDGRILAGGTVLLERARPAVLFEWAPKQCRAVGTDPLLAFEVLGCAGYDRWVFFTKYGQFSHFGNDHLEDLTQLCLTSTTLGDWHYDVAALHATSSIDSLALADLQHWGASGYG